MINKSQYAFKNLEICQEICGIADKRIDFLEKLLDVSLIPRSTILYIEANRKDKIRNSKLFFEKIQKHYIEEKESQSIDSQWEMTYKRIKEQMQNPKMPLPLLKNVRQSSIYPKNKKQEEYIHSLLHQILTFGIGPAGTGKTFLSIACACQLILEGKREQLIITRPAVEAGETLGFLPGDLEQKINPYLRPLYDALFECLGRKEVSEMLQNRQIEIAPLAYMRGRTLNNAIAILDEAQNCTKEQLKMFLTRLGQNSSMYISGDITQIDLAPGKSGLEKTAHLLKSLSEINIVYFRNQDIIRNPIVEKIVRTFEENEISK